MPSELLGRVAEAMHKEADALPDVAAGVAALGVPMTPEGLAALSKASAEAGAPSDPRDQRIAHLEASLRLALGELDALRATVAELITELAPMQAAVRRYFNSELKGRMGHV